MKPDRIFIVRHGQSQGNVDRAVYQTVPDYALQLTELGQQQATEAGRRIHSVIGFPHQSIQFYVSPFWRTRQTYLGIKNYLNPCCYKFYEDPRLREQEWNQKLGTREGYRETEEVERDNYGHFYYRFNGGESCADVFDRVSDFMGTMFRDFQKKDFPRNVIIVTHGMTMRLMLMRWYHISVEEFESWGNPANGEYYLLERREDEKYELMTPLKTHVLRHTFQFPWDDTRSFPYPILPVQPKTKQ